jgi:hypothetical protein
MVFTQKKAGNLLPWSAAVSAVIFGVISFITIYLNFSFTLPGTNVATDSRELFNIMGAALTGPFGGIITAVLSSLTPQTDFNFYIIFQHCVAAFWAGWAYKHLIYKKSTGFRAFPRWFILVFVYYFVTYTPGFFLFSFLFPANFQHFVGSNENPATILFSLYKGWLPEFTFTLIYLFCVYLAVPSKFKRPLWGTPVPENQEIKDPGLAVGFRLTLWFVILFSIPIVYLSVSARNYFINDFQTNEGISQSYVASRLAERLRTASFAESKSIIEMVNKKYERNVLLVNQDFENLAKSDSIKNKKDLLLLLDKEQKNYILDMGSGYLIDQKSGIAIGFSQIQGANLYVLSATQGPGYQISTNTFIRFILLIQGISLFVVSLLSGLIIWLIIGIPLKRLTLAAKEIGKHNYAFSIDTDGMEDEVLLLAEAVNSMKENIRIAEKEIKVQELKFHSIYEHANDAIFLLQDGLIVDCNSKTCQLFGLEKTQILHRSPTEMSPEFQPDGRRSTEKVFESLDHTISGQPLVFEWRHFRSDGTLFDAEISLNRIEIEDEVYVQAILRDVTERKEIYSALKFNEAKFRSLVSSMQELVFTLDANLLITGIFGQWAEMYGLVAEDLIGKELSVLLSTDEALANRHACQKALSGESAIFEWHLNKDSNTYYFESSLAPLIGTDGNIIGIVGVAREITERKLADQLLKESEDRYRNLIDYSPEGIVVHAEGKIIFANPAAALLIGSEPGSSYLGKNILNYVDPQYHALLVERSRFAAENMSPLAPIEVKILRLDGTALDVEISGAPVHYGTSIAIQTIIRDISYRKKAELELKKLGQAVNQSSTGIIITDKNGTIEYANRKLVEVSGFSYNEIIGKTPRIFKSGKHDRAFYENMWNSLLSGKEWHGEVYNRTKAGVFYWERNHISSIRDEHDEIIHFIAIKEDISEIKKIESELIEAKEKAEEADNLKSTLLANMSHEFRTPLNGILGFAEILKDEVTDQALSMMIEKIHKSGKRLLHTLNSVLLISQLTNDDIEVKIEAVDTLVLCKRLLLDFSKQASEKNIALTYTIPVEPIILYTDEYLLYKIASCILENAIKYTPKGFVTIDISTDESAPDKKVIIAIKDSGIGIAPGDREQIFKEFKQISEGFRRDYEGLGLGLAIANKMCSLLNGEIQVSSEPGVGSIFTVLLPLNANYPTATEATPANLELPRPASGKRSDKPAILYVEDNQSNIDVVQHFLSHHYSLRYALEGAEAIALAQKESFDILLLDVNLGHGMDGIDVLHEIKKIPNCQHIPAIAVTGYASASHKHQFLARGFTSYLPKPFTKDELLACIEDVLTPNVH